MIAPLSPRAILLLDSIPPHLLRVKAEGLVVVLRIIVCQPEKEESPLMTAKKNFDSQQFCLFYSLLLNSFLVATFTYMKT